MNFINLLAAIIWGVWLVLFLAGLYEPTRFLMGAAMAFSSMYFIGMFFWISNGRTPNSKNWRKVK